MTSPSTGILLDETPSRASTLSRFRRACHGLSYEAWHGNAFDTILSDGVLQLIDIRGEGWA